MITQFLALSGLRPSDIDDVIIASVVPKVMHSFRASIIKFLNINPMVVGPGIKTGINIRIDDPEVAGFGLPRRLRGRVLHVRRSGAGRRFRHRHDVQLRQ